MREVASGHKTEGETGYKIDMGSFLMSKVMAMRQKVRWKRVEKVTQRKHSLP